MVPYEYRTVRANTLDELVSELNYLGRNEGWKVNRVFEKAGDVRALLERPVSNPLPPAREPSPDELADVSSA
jgi:hypothetical protein